MKETLIKYHAVKCFVEKQYIKYEWAVICVPFPGFRVFAVSTRERNKQLPVGENKKKKNPPETLCLILCNLWSNTLAINQVRMAQLP